MDDFLFKSLVMNCAHGLLAGQTDDRRYIDTPEKKKEDLLAEDAFKFAMALMKKFNEADKTAKESHG